MFINEEIIVLINPILAVMLILLVYLGYRKGFLSKVLSCISFMLVVLVGWNLAKPLSHILNILPKEYAPFQNTILADFFYAYVNQIMIFVVIVLLASLVLFLLKPIISLFKKMPVISFVNAVFGGFLGVVEMVLLCFVLLFVLHSPIIENGSEVIDRTCFKYVEVLQDKVFKVGNTVLKEFDFVSSSMDHAVNEDDLRMFLVEHGYSDEDIQKFILDLMK